MPQKETIKLGVDHILIGDGDGGSETGLDLDTSIDMDFDLAQLSSTDGVLKPAWNPFAEVPCNTNPDPNPASDRIPERVDPLDPAMCNWSRPNALDMTHYHVSIGV